MPIYKNKDNGTWYVMTQYTNWKGERKPKRKRGFDTKRDAQEWEHTFRQQNSGDLDMPFSAFLRSEVKNYKLLHKVFGHKQIDELLEQVRNIKGRKREKPRSR